MRGHTVVAASGEIKSNPIELKIGITHGSCKSNLTFSVLMDDLPEAVLDAELLMYADDVVAIVTAPQGPALEQKLNDVARQLAHWFRVNGLALNPRKTNILHFNLSGRRYPPLSVSMEGEALRQVDAFTMVGFNIDRSLTWTGHVDTLCDKLGRACFALDQVARVLSQQAVRACYYATFQSLLTYGVDLWGRSAEWERAFVLQKRAVRIIAQVKPLTPAKELFKELGLMTLPALYLYHTSIYVYKNISSFVKFGDLHERQTRYNDKLVMPVQRLTKSHKCTRIFGVKVFNALPNPIKNATSLPVFKNKLKIFLTDMAPYSVEEFVPILE